MYKVVPLFKIFTTIFYFKFLKLGKVNFGSVKIQMSLNFKFKWI
jgi:hypothetical protein